jgi:hypothetical protein
MHSFKSFLAEEASEKLIHIEHAEDRPINDGSTGFHHVMSVLRLAKTHIQQGRHDSQLSMKYDGSPSLVYGHHPKTGKFFVASKSAFNVNPKLNYTPADIEKNHGHAPGLVHKLNAALEHLPKVAPKKGVYQGDVKFSHDDKKVDDKGNISFTPNTLTYTAKKGSEDHKKISDAKFGIVTHQQYHGDDISTMKVSPHPDLHKFTPHKDVYQKNPDHDTSKVSMSNEQNKEFEKHLNSADAIHNKHSDRLYSHLDHNREHVKTYINQTVRTGETPSVEGLRTHISEKYNKKIDKLKTDKAKSAQRSELQSHHEHLDKHKKDIENLFKLHHHIQKAKDVLVDVLNQNEGGLSHSINEKKSKPEGFVFHHEGEPTKLVNRAEFARANFLKNR